MRFLLVGVCLMLPPAGVSARTSQAQPTQIQSASSAPGSRSALAALFQACPSAAEADCEIVLSEPEELTLAGSRVVAPGRTLRILPGGVLTLHGGTLDFGTARGGSPLEAPQSHVFRGTGQVRGLVLARPEWFADPGSDGTYPAEALARAYDATVVSGTLQLGPFRYLSPFSARGGLSLGSPRIFVGTGRPRPDSDAAPTRLLAGTVLVGGIRGAAPLEALHLGIDTGPAVTARYLGGKPQPALALTGRVPGAGTRLADVAVLTAGLDREPSVAIRAQRDVRIEDLYLWSLHGKRGLSLGVDRSAVNGFHCTGAAIACLTLGGVPTPGYAATVAFNTLSDLDIHAFQKLGDTGGIEVDARAASVRDLLFRGIREDGTTYGVSLRSSWLFRPQHIGIQGWSAEETQGPCLTVEPAADIDVSHFVCGWRAGAVTPAIWLNAQGVHLSDGLIVETSGSRSAASSVAVEDFGTGTALAGLHGLGALGPQLRSAHSPSPGQLQAAGVALTLGAAPSRGLLDAASLRLRQALEALHVLWLLFKARSGHPWIIVTLFAALAGLLLDGLLRGRRQGTPAVRDSA